MKTELRIHNQKPTVFVNGKPHHSIFCSVQEKYFSNFVDAGFEIIDTHPTLPVGWVDDGKYDYTLTDQTIERYLDQKKDAQLILRFWMGYPDRSRGDYNVNSTRGYWWGEKYPEQNARTFSSESVWTPFPSFASEQWRRDAGEALKRVIEHVEGKYGENIFAYVPGGGSCGEWFQYYTFALEANHDPADYSDPMINGFREYIRGLYNNDISLLNGFWNSTYKGFQEVMIPGPGKRFGPAMELLRDPLQEKPVLDFYEYYNEVVADTLIEWSRKAKEGCNGNKLIMAFYGYLWVSSERHSQTRSGHIHLGKVLKSPDIDMIVAPYMYDVREVGGVVSSQTVPGSIRNSGKMCLVEIEPATSIKADWCYGNHLPQTHQESVELMKRDLAYTLANGAACWYMDLNGGMYDHPELIKGLDAVRRVGETYSVDAGRNNAEIAIILNDRSSFYFKEGEPFFGTLVNMFKVWELERVGAPFDDLLLSDLANVDTGRYKLFIIPNAVYLSESERALIKEKCCRSKNTVVWCYAAGVLSETGFSLEKMKDATGIETGYTREPGELVVEITDSQSPYLKGLHKGICYGTNGNYLPIDAIKEQACLKCYPDAKTGFSVSPRFWVEDSDAEAFGLLKELNKPGLAVKKMEDWTSVFSSAPMIPKELLRNVAREAGCHVYTDFPGQTMACENYFGFYAHSSGECKISLPYKAWVKDVFTDRIISEGTDEIRLNVCENTTVLLHYIPADK